MVRPTSSTAHRFDDGLPLSAEAKWAWERKTALSRPCAGVDEVGRGCLAGPVFAAAVILGGRLHRWIELDDSKVLSKAKRDRLYGVISEHAVAVSVAMADVAEIDTYNILHASRLAMARALSRLTHLASSALVDGPYGPWFLSMPPIPCLPVIDGDAKSLSIAAASIVAKVERDRFMAKLAGEYPEYGFDQNVGYGTPQHLAALEAHGPTPWHRTSFSPVRKAQQMRFEL